MFIKELVWWRRWTQVQRTQLGCVQSPFRLKGLFPQLLGVLWAGGRLLSAVSGVVYKVQPASSDWSIPGYKSLTFSTQVEVSQKGHSSDRGPGGGGGEVS